ncbi:MAG: LamG-like jellyroll fold domain-containing protein, partial [Gemmatimonadaceae bacterium]
TWDGTTGRVYINGVLDGSGPINSLPNNTLDLRIGADSNGNDRFNGLIDEAAVHNVALSAAQIAAIVAGDNEAPRCNGDICTADAACASGFCVDGVCCDTACGSGAPNDCQACSVAAGAAVDGICGPRSWGSVCRAAQNTCDLTETCDGTALTCPADAFRPNLSICTGGFLGIGVCLKGDCFPF